MAASEEATGPTLSHRSSRARANRRRARADGGRHRRGDWARPRRADRGVARTRRARRRDRARPNTRCAAAIGVRGPSGAHRDRGRCAGPVARRCGRPGRLPGCRQRAVLHHDATSFSLHSRPHARADPCFWCNARSPSASSRPRAHRRMARYRSTCKRSQCRRLPSRSRPALLLRHRASSRPCCTSSRDQTRW